MDPGAAIAAGLALGLSTGGYCFWSCAAVMAPYLVSTETGLSRQRWASVAGAFRAVGYYNLGRLLAYLTAGVAVSLLADSHYIPPRLQAVALLFTAALLAFAVLRPSSRSHCWKHRGRRAGGAFLMGVLQGLNPCPPFLMAVGLAMTTPGVVGGTLLFLSLFVGTSLFTLPLVFLEPLRRRGWLFGALRILGGLVCLYLVIRAAVLLAG